MRATLSVCRPGLLSSLLFASTLSFASAVHADGLPIVTDVQQQPLVAATERLIEAMNYVGAPFSPADLKTLRVAMRNTDATESITGIQRILDKYCVAGVKISAESRVKVAEGDANKELVQQGWRTFLVKVSNQAGINPKLVAVSPNAAPQFRRSRGAKRPKIDISAADVAQRFLSIEMFDKQPLKPKLSGLELEYRIIQLYSRDVGRREAKLAFNVGQGTQCSARDSAVQWATIQ